MELEERLKGRIRCFLKNTKRVFKLYFLPSQIKNCKLLEEFERLNPKVAASFIAAAQSSFTGIDYHWNSSAIVRKKAFINEPYTKIIVLPEQLLRAITHPHTMLSDDFIFEEVYPELVGVNCFVIDANSSYAIYDVLSDTVDNKLIKFNPQFDDLIRHLIDKRLNDPKFNNDNYSLRYLMNLVNYEMERKSFRR